jgi:hypothetical protein
MTLRERYIRFLQAHDYTVVNTRTSKAIVLKHPVIDAYYFIGKRGSVRVAVTSNYTQSNSCDIKASLERWENEQSLAKEK